MDTRPQIAQGCISLRSPMGWHYWIGWTRTMANRLGVWEYMDPALENHPKMPNPRSIKRPTPASVSDGKAKHLSKLTAEQLMNLDYRIDEYDYYVERVQKTRNYLAKMSTWIRQTVHKPYQYLINRKGVATPCAMLRALQRKIKPSDEYCESKIIGRYRALRTRELRADGPPISAQKLIRQWGSTVLHGKLLGVRDVESASYDFLDLIKPVDPFFSRPLVQYHL